jgi:hypothetical protein
MKIAIYGSALTDPDNARDLDVRYTGSQQDAAPLVEAWAAVRGLGHLPVDWHRQDPYWDVLQIPAPCGVMGPFEVLTPDTKVRARPVWDLSSYIRLHGDDVATLAAHLPASTRVSLAEDPDRDPEDTYVQGLTALRNAVGKAADPAAVTELLTETYGPLMGRILTEDPRPTAETLKHFWNSYAQGICLVLQAGEAPYLQYGYNSESPESLLYP